MKNKKLRIILATAMFFGASTLSPGVFADNYGIVYQGGEVLGEDNVTIDPGLIKSLTPLLRHGYSTNTPNGSTRWKSAYVKEIRSNGEPRCRSYYYISVSNNNPITADDGVGFTISNDNYRAEITVKGASLEGFSDDAVVTLSIVPEHAFLYAGWNPYEDASCETATPGISPISVPGGNVDGRVFADLNIKLYKNGEDTVFKSDELFFGITDVDAAQSFRILNQDNLLTKQSMFAEDAAGLQDPNPDATLRNYFVSNGNYIYSEFGDRKTVATDNTSNIYVKLTDDTQENGLDVVFGYASSAGSGIEYYTKQYTVTYESDNNGTITGITDEKVISGNNPAGSTENPGEHYASTYWTANKDVTLSDGTTIAEGDPITSDQITKVVVNQDITFTIHHVRQYTVTYKSDDGGTISGITNENVNTNANPAGSTQTPNEHYVFTYWTADKKVTLKDGTTIPAGDPITSEQIKNVVVDQDITFTAVHAVSIVTPDTGKSTKEKSSAFSLSPFFGEILGAFIVAIVLGLVAKMIKK